MRGVGRSEIQRIAWSLGLTTRHDGDDDVSGDEELGLSAGDGLEALGEGEEEEVEVVEVDEEELKEEWAARGLDPAAFDPLVLLEMWEAEDAEVNKQRCYYGGRRPQISRPAQEGSKLCKNCPDKCKMQMKPSLGNLQPVTLCE